MRSRSAFSRLAGPLALCWCGICEAPDSRRCTIPHPSRLPRHSKGRKPSVKPVHILPTVLSFFSIRCQKGTACGLVVHTAPRACSPPEPRLPLCRVTHARSRGRAWGHGPCAEASRPYWRLGIKPQTRPTVGSLHQRWSRFSESDSGGERTNCPQRQTQGLCRKNPRPGR